MKKRSDIISPGILLFIIFLSVMFCCLSPLSEAQVNAPNSGGNTAAAILGVEDEAPAPSNWAEDFDGTEIDTKMPEPAWTIITQGDYSVRISEGYLHLSGGKGFCLGGLCNESIRMYSNFSLHTKLTFINPASTNSGQEANAEIRFRVKEGAGYSLSFKCGDRSPAINLRNSTTWELIQNKEVKHNFYPGEILYVSVNCKDSRLIIKIGTSAGGEDVVSWDFLDPTFSKGSFWIQGYQIKAVDVDYFYVLPFGSNPFLKQKPALIPPVKK